MTDEELDRFEAEHNARMAELAEWGIDPTRGQQIITSLLQAIRERRAELAEARAKTVEVPVLGTVE